MFPLITMPIFIAALLSIQETDAVLLRNYYKAGDKLSYTMTAVLSGEIRAGGLHSGVPFKATEKSKYTITVLEEAPEGTADVRLVVDESVTRYAELFEEEPWEEREEPQWAILTISPTNEVLRRWDWSKPKRKPQPEKDEGDAAKSEQGREKAEEKSQEQGKAAKSLTSLLSNQVRFHGLVELGPSLPWYPVKPGDTWQGTLSMLPGQDVSRDPSLRASRATRLDITYRYDGIQDRDGRRVHVIGATYSADLDMKAAVLRSLPRAIVRMNPIKSVALKVNGTLEFLLDAATGKTLRTDWRADTEFDLQASPGLEEMGYSLKGKLVAVVESTKP